MRAKITRNQKPETRNQKPETRNQKPETRNKKTFSMTLLENAYAWLIRQRKDYPDNADIWHLRFHWQRERNIILTELNSGTFRFSPLQIIKKASGETLALWCSRDALVLKMLTMVLSSQLPAHPLCEHIRGHGGGRQSTLRVHRHLNDTGTPYVFRTDIKGYYAAIDKQRLYDQLAMYRKRFIRALLPAQLMGFTLASTKYDAPALAIEPESRRYSFQMAASTLTT